MAYVVNQLGQFVPLDQIQPDPSIVDAAQPMPDQRLALNLAGAPPDLATIRGLNARDQSERRLDASPGVHSPAPPIAGTSGPIDMRAALNRPMPVAPPTAPGAQSQAAASGAPIFASPKASRPTAAMPSGAYVLREGRFVPAQRTVQSQTPVSDETELNEKRALTNQMATNAQIGEHQAETEQGRADILTDTAGGLQKMQADAAAAEQGRQERLQGAMDKYGQMQRALQSEQIDPAHAFRNTSDFQKFTNSILLGLGTFGSTLAGGENAGMKLFTKRIDDDIAAQNKNLENKQQGLANQRGMVAMMREQFGDQRAADAAAKMAYIDMAKQRVDAWAASNGSQAARDRAAEANNILSTEWNKSQAALERSGVVSTHQVYQPAGVYGTGAGKKPNEADVKHLDTELRKEKIPQAYSALDDLEGAIDTTGTGDIEGLGVVGQHVPDMLTSDKGIANRQAVEKAVLAVAHATGRVTPAEVDLVRQAAIRNGSARGLRNWVKSQRAELGNVDRSVRASVPQEAEQLYEQRGGLAPRDNSGPTAVRPAGE